MIKVIVTKTFEIEIPEFVIEEMKDSDFDYDFSNYNDVIDFIESSYDLLESDETNIRKEDFENIRKIWNEE